MVRIDAGSSSASSSSSSMSSSAPSSALSSSSSAQQKQQQQEVGGTSTIEHFFQEKPLTLDDIRSTLIRLEETIIFALIERAQFKANPAVYAKEADLGHKSFLDLFFGQIEKAHSLMRRYTSPDEHPYYPDELERPILPLLNYSAVVRPNNININPKARARPPATQMQYIIINNNNNSKIMK